MKILKRLLGEFLGTFVVLFCTVGSQCVLSAFNIAVLSEISSCLIVAAVAGVSYIIMSYATRKLSGGHFNPAISFTVWMYNFFKVEEEKTMKWYDIFFDILGQLLGTALLYVCMFFIFGKDCNIGLADISFELMNFSPKYYLYYAMIFQAIVTMIISGVSIANKDNKSFTCIIYGITVGFGIFISYIITGGTINPIRYIGATVTQFIMDAWFVNIWNFSLFNLNSYLVYVIFPIASGLLVGTFAGLFSLDAPKEDTIKELPYYYPDQNIQVNPEAISQSVITPTEDDEVMPEEYKKMYDESIKESEVKEEAPKKKKIVQSAVNDIDKKLKEEAKNPQEEPVIVDDGNEDAPESIFIERKSFLEKLAVCDKDIKEKYKQIRKEIMSYQEIKARTSFEGETFRAHRTAYVFLALRGKGLKCCFNLDPKQFEGSPIPIENLSNKKKYEEYPCELKVKSDLSCKRAIQLVQQVMEENGFKKII